MGRYTVLKKQKKLSKTLDFFLLNVYNPFCVPSRKATVKTPTAEAKAQGATRPTGTGATLYKKGGETFEKGMANHIRRACVFLLSIGRARVLYGKKEKRRKQGVKRYVYF